MSRKIKFALELGALAVGTILFYQLIRSVGPSEVLRVLRSSAGAWAVFLFYPLMCIWDVWSWHVVLTAQGVRSAGLAALFRIRLAGEALNNVTPFLDVGGEPLKVHLLKGLGISGQTAFSSVLVARTSLYVSEILFMAGGLAGSFILFPGDFPYRYALIALGILSAAAVAALTFQRRGFIKKIAPEAARFYSERSPAFDKAVLLNFIGWVMGGVEMTLLCRMAGLPVTWWQGLALESLLQLVRTASFFIPGNLGVQEGGMAFMVGLMGYDPVLGVSISLLKRCRQLLWTAAGFGVWGWIRWKA